MGGEKFCGGDEGFWGFGILGFCSFFLGWDLKNKKHGVNGSDKE
jgi:hypothetical protein